MSASCTDSIVPTYSTSPVNIAQISLDCEIRAKPFDGDVLQFLHGAQARGRRSCARSSSCSRWPRELGREEHAHFIHNSGGEGGRIQNRSGFEQQAQNFATAEFNKDRAWVWFRAAAWEAYDFHSGAAQGARLRGIFFYA